MSAVIEPTLRVHQSGIAGAGPGLWYGTDAPDGDAGAWAEAPVGSRYYRKMGEGGIWYQKVSTKLLNGSWRPTDGAIVQTVTESEFTDGTAAVGTLVMTYQIPIGATVKRVFLQALTGFTGNSSCALTVGDGSTADRYNTGTPSIYTTAAGETDLGAVSGTAYHAAAASVTLTATGGSDWTAVTAGAMTVVIVIG